MAPAPLLHVWPPNGVRIVEASSTNTSSISVSWLAVNDDTTSAEEIRYELHASTDPRTA